MKVIVTGANGFIGSYLCEYLNSQGIHVIALSRKFHPSTKELLGKLQMLEIDLLDRDSLMNLNLQADVIVHVATANDIVSKDTLKGIELSVLGTKNMMDFAVKNNISKAIVFSTLQVYGTELEGEISENTEANCLNDYGLNHLFAEQYAKMYTSTGKLHCVAVRPSNVYGRIKSDSFNRWTLVPGCFCKEALEQGTITIKSSGKQMRNFVSLENLSKAVWAILKNYPKQFEVFNLVSSERATMLEVAQIVKDVFHKLYGKTIDIRVEGTLPEKTNFFSISLEKLNKIGFSEDTRYNLNTEIEQIFHYLTNKKANHGSNTGI